MAIQENLGSDISKSYLNYSFTLALRLYKKYGKVVTSGKHLLFRRIRLFRLHK
jgi:hypothetical protein